VLTDAVQLSENPCKQSIMTREEAQLKIWLLLQEEYL